MAAIEKRTQREHRSTETQRFASISTFGLNLNTKEVSTDTHPPFSTLHTVSHSLKRPRILGPDTSMAFQLWILQPHFALAGEIPFYNAKSLVKVTISPPENHQSRKQSRTSNQE